MKVEKETIVIVFLIALVLGPMWFFALVSAEKQSPVALSQEEGVIAPAERFLPTPVEINELIAGVVTWVALFVLVGMIFYTHQFIRTVGQSEEPVAADGGARPQLPSSLSFLSTDDRRLVDYWPAQFATPGMVGVAVMSWLSAVFALLFVMETFGYARTQFLGIYGGMLFLSLGVLVAVYVTWFLPSAHVVETRGHAQKIAEEGDQENE